MATIWSHHPQAAGPLMGTHPVPMTGPATGSGGGGSSSTSGAGAATITANDFLTLLVTEMQNQDPTADNDPNAYIDQLVQVNSLEQLIDINQNLSTALGDTSATGNSSGTPEVSPAGAGTAPLTADGAPAVLHGAAQKSSALGQVQSAAASASQSSPFGAQGPHAKVAPGNLSVPDRNPSAHRVAQSLGKHARGS
jgi:flagellar basal-body rod modification protein FlgD